MDNLNAVVLNAFSETGTEGIIWSVDQDGLEGREALRHLRNGDLLRVFDATGSILFEGEIRLEWERNYRPYPLNPSLGQQAVHGFWVRGLQIGVEREAWSSWFHSRLRCEFRQLEHVSPLLAARVSFGTDIVEERINRALDSFLARAEDDPAGACSYIDTQWCKHWDADWDVKQHGISYDIPKRLYERADQVARKHGFDTDSFLSRIVATLCVEDAGAQEVGATP